MNDLFEKTIIGSVSIFFLGLIAFCVFGLIACIIEASNVYDVTVTQGTKITELKDVDTYSSINDSPKCYNFIFTNSNELALCNVDKIEATKK